MPNRKKGELPFSHPDTCFVASVVGGHRYIVTHKAGQEAEAIEAIDRLVENPELNLTEEDGEKMSKRVKLVKEYQDEKAEIERMRREKKKREGGR